MNIPDFVAKWKSSTLTERASAQAWFSDLCRVLGFPTPTDSDVSGDTYTFERGATKTGGGNGWADVWMRGHFAWEFKGKHADLTSLPPLAPTFSSMPNTITLVVTLRPVRPNPFWRNIKFFNRANSSIKQLY